MDGGYLESYNKREHQRHLSEYERTIDKISDPIEADSELGQIFNTGTHGLSFFVNIINQPAHVTKVAKSLGDGAMPEGYNNIALYSPWNRTWTLRFESF